MRLGVWLTGLLVLICACSEMPRVPEQASLPERDAQVSRLEHWQFNAKVGYRAPGESGSLYLDWRQASDRYRIRLQGPLGQGATEINGTDEGVLVTQGDRLWQGQSAEALMEQLFGWQLPVQQLRYWLLALPVPGVAQAGERDERGLLVRQQQGEWLLTYSQYRWVAGQVMPGKIKARADKLGLQLTVLIKEWQLQ